MTRREQNAKVERRLEEMLRRLALTRASVSLTSLDSVAPHSRRDASFAFCSLPFGPTFVACAPFRRRDVTAPLGHRLADVDLTGRLPMAPTWSTRTVESVRLRGSQDSVRGRRYQTRKRWRCLQPKRNGGDAKQLRSGFQPQEGDRATDRACRQEREKSAGGVEAGSGERQDARAAEAFLGVVTAVDHRAAPQIKSHTFDRLFKKSHTTPTIFFFLKDSHLKH